MQGLIKNKNYTNNNSNRLQVILIDHIRNNFSILGQQVQEPAEEEVEAHQNPVAVHQDS